MRHTLLRTAAATVAAAAWMIPAGAQAAPPAQPFNDNDATWGCFGDPGAPVPPAHCINVRSRGTTGVIKVFDDRWPQESISTDPRSDSRPCPQDAGSPDGTWWTPPGTTGIWVCHHNGS